MLVCMAAVAYDLKRLFLRGIKWDADGANISLREALEKVAKAHIEDLHAGRVIASTGLGGASVTFTFPSAINPADITALCSEMLDRYDEALAVLPTDPASTDDQIFAEMLAGIRRITTIRPDFRTLSL